MTGPRVMNILPDLSMGGGQVVVLRHLKVMAARGLRPVVAYCEPCDDLAPQLLEAGVELVDLGVRGLGSSRKARQRLIRAIEGHDVDVVQTHGTRLDKFYGHAAALGTRALHVTTLHGNPPQTWRKEPGLRAGARRAKNEALFFADWSLGRRTLRGVVAVSHAAAEGWRPILGRYRVDAPVEVIYSGIPMDGFGRGAPERISALRQDLAGDAGGPILLGVSRLWPGKDVDELVEIMPAVLQAHPTTVLVLAGDGPERKRIEARIRELDVGPRVRLLGQRQDVPDLLQASDLLLFPSKNEGFGLVALEALASAVPVVCFDLPSLATLRADTDALQVVDEPSVTALAQRVARLLSDSSELAALGERGRAVIAEKWNVERSTDAYLGFYERLLAQR